MYKCCRTVVSGSWLRTQQRNHVWLYLGLSLWRVLTAFISLLDNYESDTGVPEIVTPEEEAENHKFLDAITQTPTMKVVSLWITQAGTKKSFDLHKSL